MPIEPYFKNRTHDTLCSLDTHTYTHTHIHRGISYAPHASIWKLYSMLTTLLDSSAISASVWFLPSYTYRHIHSISSLPLPRLSITIYLFCCLHFSPSLFASFVFYLCPFSRVSPPLFFFSPISAVPSSPSSLDSCVCASRCLSLSICLFLSYRSGISS